MPDTAPQEQQKSIPASELSPAVVRDETPQCLRCGKPLRLVTNPPGSWMNDDQFDSVKRGDWYCEPCGDPIDKDGRSYFRESQVRSASPVSVPEERQDEARVATADELRAFLRNLRIDSRAGDGGRIARLASALDALAVAVKPVADDLAEQDAYHERIGRPAPLVYRVVGKDLHAIIAAITSLLDGRTTT